jgi:outer membrane receptor for ferrienterochelin and colicins
LNGAFVNKKKTSALSLFAALKKRQALDVNGDGFSEIPLVNGNSIGLTYDQKLFKQFNFQLNTFLLNEVRRGGNKFHLSPEQTDQCEFRDQLTTMNQGSLQWNGKKISVQLFSGFQSTQRKHYTGVNQVDGWGTTSNHTVQTGLQVNYKHPFFKGNMWWLLGGEHLLEDVLDRVDAYQYLIDQRIDQKAVYLQNQWEASEKWTILGGIRLNKHSRVETMYATPRLALLYKPTNRLQIRINYGKGVKAAQVLETDMHMAFANGGVSTVLTDHQLKSESSNALTATVDWNKRFGAFAFSLTGNAFYTELRNPFVLEEIGQDSSGNTMLFRTNGSTAKVKGVSLEVKILWSTSKLYVSTDLVKFCSAKQSISKNTKRLWFSIGKFVPKK